MKRKMFYTLMRKSGIVGVKEQEGYELEIAGRKFFGYIDTDQQIHIIDPRNGLSIAYDDTAEEIIIDEVQTIKEAAKKAIDNGIIDRLKIFERKRSYKLTMKAFRTYVKAELLMEKQQQAADAEYRKAMEANRKETP